MRTLDNLRQPFGGLRARIGETFLALILTLLATASASAQILDPAQVWEQGVDCPADHPDAPNNFTCNSNDITLTLVELSNLTSCTEGETATATFDVDLSVNANIRYNPMIWISSNGIDPRVTGSMCFVSSVPDGPLTHIPQLLFDDVNDCADINVPNNGFILDDLVLGPVQFECRDTDNDGKAEIPIIVTWNNSGGAACAQGTYPINQTPSKCDAFTAETDIDVIVIPGLDLTKSGVFQDENMDGFAQPGETISYTLTIENTGQNSTLTNILVADPLITDPPNNGTITCPGGNPIPSLAVGATAVCTASYSVTQGDIDFGAVLNTATATSDQDSDTANANVPLPQNPVVQVDKSGSPDFMGAPQAGDTITYTFNVTNTGNLTLTNLPVTDTIVASISCTGGNPIASLAPGESAPCTGNYTLTQADIDNGSVSNEVTVTSDQGASDTDQDTQPLQQVIELTLNKSANPTTYNAASQNITYTYVLTNSGNVTLHGPYAISDDKATATCDPTPDPLLPGQSVNCSANYTITQADLDAGSVTNTATGTALDPADQTVTSNEDMATVTVEVTGTLQLVKTAMPSNYDEVGDIISYSYALTNGTNQTLHGPYSITDDRTTATCDATPDPLAPGQTVNCSATYVITQADLDAGEVMNTATGTALNPNDQVVTSNEDSETVTAIVTGSLALDKTAMPSTYNTVGQVISYSYQLTNNTNVTLSAPYTIDDDRADDESCAAAPPTMAPGESVICTASYTIDQADLDAGSVTNVATGTAQDPDGGTVTSNEDTETVNAERTGSLTLVKGATPQTYTQIDDVISYSYELTNNTNVTLYPPYTITDNKTSATCPGTPASLAPGDSVSCSASYSIVQADIDAGSVTNVATGTAQDPNDQTVTSNESSQTVTLVVTGTLQLIKSAMPTIYDTVGQLINYDYALTNGTNITLYPPYVIDDDVATDELCPGLGQLDPGTTVNCAATHTISQADLDAGSVTNVAVGTAQDAPENGNTVTSNPDSATVNAVVTGGLRLVKTATPQTYSVLGDMISYEYVLSNDTNVTLYPPYTIADDKTSATCPGVPANLAPGDSVTCSAMYTIVQGDIDATFVTNTATGTAQDPDGQTVTSNEDNATVNLDRTGSLLLEKTATPTTFGAAGEMISYNYLLTNNTNITLYAPFVIDDDKSVDEACPPMPTSLAPTESITCTATYTITAGDVTAGSVTNTAFGTAQDAPQGGQPVQSNTDTATVSAVVLNLAKTAAAPSYNAVTGRYTVVYTITATNSGSAAGSYNLVDTFAPGAGITLYSAVLAYGGGETQTGMPAGDLPYSFSSGETLVTGEGLGGGASEMWTVTAQFEVDPSQVDDSSRGCVVGQEQSGQGFYNSVAGIDSEIDTTDNDACNNLPDPSIDLSKTAGEPVYNGNGSFTVVYTVTANNVGQGPGYYDLTDVIDPGNGITVTSAELTSYNAGTEDSITGTPAGVIPFTFSSGATIVTNEALAAQRDESWTITVAFNVAFGQTDDTLQCSEVNGGAGTGFYNRAEGSASDPDLTNNDDCVNPTGGEVVFRVIKDFLDDNTDLVNVHISCDTGLPLDQDKEIGDISFDEGVGFIVVAFEPGELDCEIYETPVPAGYEPTYQAGLGDLAIAESYGATPDACVFNGVVGGEFTCEITNDPQPVAVTVNKFWEIYNPGQGSEFPLEAEVTLWCDAPIVGGTENQQTGYWFLEFDVFGDTSRTEYVVPAYPSSRCWAVESNETSYVEALNDCGDSFSTARMIVSVGSPAQCTITNTVFFEGIPTLSRTGLALLALLMLGVGFVGFRRFA